MRLLTYNIHGCKGRGGAPDPDAVLAVIEEADADVVALQEVHDENAADHSFLRALETRFDYPCILREPLLRQERRRCGNVLMSRIPPAAEECIDLSRPGSEPRGAIRVRLRDRGREFEITATHLGLGPRERLDQIRQLARSDGKPNDAEDESIRVLMGDLNEWFPFGRAIRLLRTAFGTACPKRTFPARWPLFALDRIHVRPSTLRLVEHPLRSPTARTASDHLPLLVELEV